MFSKPNAIIYVRRTGLVLAGKRLTPARLSFDTAVIANLEVVDHESFIANCQSFFTAQKLHGKHILMVLDDSLIFSKSAPLDNPSEINAIQDDFMNAMPLNPGQRACLSVKASQSVALYATNADIYTDIAQAIHAAGAGRLLAVTPASAYDTPVGAKLATAIQKYVNDTTVRSEANFTVAQVV